MRPGDHSQIEGTYTRRHGQIRCLGLFQDLPRLAKVPFEHEEWNARVPRQVWILMAASLDHPFCHQLCCRDDPFSLRVIVRLEWKQHAKQLQIQVPERRNVIAASAVRGDRSGV